MQVDSSYPVSVQLQYHPPRQNDELIAPRHFRYLFRHSELGPGRPSGRNDRQFRVCEADHPTYPFRAVFTRGYFYHCNDYDSSWATPVLFKRLSVFFQIATSTYQNRQDYNASGIRCQLAAITAPDCSRCFCKRTDRWPRRRCGPVSRKCSRSACEASKLQSCLIVPSTREDRCTARPIFRPTLWNRSTNQ